MADVGNNLKDLNLTKDEVDRLAEAFKNEEFRKLFAEYAEEISDPENRKKYEAELTQLEQERGMDIKFIHPNAGHVLKTSKNGQQKLFINVCTNEHIQKPSFTRKADESGHKGMSWLIPHSFSKPKEVIDKSGKRCEVCDFVVHPDTYRMGETNIRFRKLVEDTALDGAEKMFGFKVDKKNVKRPKLKYKGTPEATVLRTKKENHKAQETISDVLPNLKYPYDNKTSVEKAKEMEKEAAKKIQQEAKSKKCKLSSKDIPAEHVVPEYIIKHQRPIQYEDFTIVATPSLRPKSLVVEVSLPLLKSGADVNLDIFKKQLVLQSDSPAKYKLDLTLPYEVDENEGSAKFDKGQKKLIISLPVVGCEKESPKLFNGTHSSLDADEERASVLNIGNGCMENESRKPLVEVISNGNGTVDHQHDDMKSMTLEAQPSSNCAHVNGADGNLAEKSPSIEVQKYLIENGRVNNPSSTGDSLTHSKHEGQAEIQPPIGQVSQDIKDPLREQSGPQEHNGLINGDLPADLANGHDIEATNWQANDKESNDTLVTSQCMGDVLTLPAKNVFYSLPSFTYHQNDEAITVVIHAKNVDRSTFTKKYLCDELGCYGIEVTMLSVGTGGFPMNYKLRLVFDGGNTLEQENCYIDIGTYNVVINLIKADAALGLWDKFEAGRNPGDMQVKLFLTEHNLVKRLDDLDSVLQSDGRVLDTKDPSLPEVDVEDMKTKELNITINPQDSSLSRSRSFSECSEDIQVVFDTAPPQLQGILKRSTSESSSDDHLRQKVSSDSADNTDDIDIMDTESPNSSLKKSVSFSAHIDQTVFKPSQTVSSMKAVLNSKRQKQERKEQARAYRQANGGGRRRRTSSGGSGSEQSSDDPSTEEHHSSESTEEGTASPKKQHQANSSRRNRRSKKATAKILQMSAASANGAMQSGQEEMASVPFVNGQECEGSKAIDGQSATSIQEASPTVDREENHAGTGPSSAASVGKVQLQESLEADSDDDDEIKQPVPTTTVTAAGAAQKDPFKPETLLSWKDSNTDAHRTTCAVQFTNSCAFDLDLD